MDPKLRPLPYDNPEARARGIRLLMQLAGKNWREASKLITKARREAMRTPMPGEVCCAFARSTGRPCQAPAGPNGRCKLHGGKSTGPRTEAGLARTVEALRSGLMLWRKNHQTDDSPETAVKD
jgi:hypothetical protein